MLLKLSAQMQARRNRPPYSLHAAILIMDISEDIRCASAFPFFAAQNNIDHLASRNGDGLIQHVYDYQQ